MTQSSAVVALQRQALIGLLERDQTDACTREAQLADTRARETVRAAHREARRLVHEAAQDERSRRDLALAQARAAVETRRRQTAQREASRIVDAAWIRLPAVLRGLWNDAAHREAWWRTAIIAAARVLETDRWELHCAAPALQAEMKRLADFARATGVHEVAALIDPQIEAGVAIRSAGATFDATLVGLLSVRQAIEAELHAEWLAEALR
jgi:hypothetical protein